MNIYVLSLKFSPSVSMIETFPTVTWAILQISAWYVYSYEHSRNEFHGKSPPTVVPWLGQAYDNASGCWMSRLYRHIVGPGKIESRWLVVHPANMFSTYIFAWPSARVKELYHASVYSVMGEARTPVEGMKWVGFGENPYSGGLDMCKVLSCRSQYTF